MSIIVKSGSSTDLLSVNADGSINVNLVGGGTSGLTITHNEITSVVSGVETSLLTLTPSTSNLKLLKIDVSGDNVALFRVKIDGVVVYNKRSWWNGFNQTFDFKDFTGLLLSVGQTLTVTVLHNRPNLGAFEATAMSV